MLKKENNDLSGMKVLLLEGFARQTLPLMEALHKLGCQVTTYNKSRLDPGYASRYPDRKLLAFWDRADETASAEALIKVLKEEHYDVTIPMTDFSAALLAKRKSEFAQYTQPAVNSWEVFQQASDKWNTMMACRENGIPCPKTAERADSVEQILESGLSYPFVIKPRTGYGSIGFHCIHTKAELKDLFSDCRKKHGPMLAQEYIPQSGVQYKCEVFIDRDGTAKSAFVFDKTRWYPVDGGSTCCSTAVKREDIAENSIKLLQAIGWQGYGDVDLIEDPRDGAVKVMEINPRITASVKLCFASGVDFARQIIEYETGRTVTDFSAYQEGKVLRYLHTDLLWFIQSADRFHAKPSWFSMKNTTDQIWNPRDPLPFFTYSLQAVSKFGPEMQKRKR